MKKLLFLALLVAGCLSGYTQTEKGSWIISLQGNYISDPHTPNLLKPNLKIKPAAHWMIIDNLGLGASFLSTLPDAGFYSLETALFVRKYFGKYAVKPYIEMTPGIKHTNTSWHSTNDFILRPGAGIIYWFHKKVGIDTNINLDLLSKYTEWNWNFGLNVSF